MTKRTFRKQLDYIKASEVIEELKNQLRIYFDSNMVDDSILYTELKRLLSKFKYDHLPHKFCLVQIENSKGELPSDYKYMCLALACTEKHCNTSDRYNETIHTEEQEVCELNLCETKCDVCHDDCGNMFKIVQKFNRYPEVKTWTSFDLMCPTKRTRPNCTKGSPNFKSKSVNEIDISNGVINTSPSFSEGVIYIEYIGSLETEDDYLIPENETIIDWIRKALRFAVFDFLYFNGEPNVQQRRQDAKLEASIAHENARAIYKRSEQGDYYKLANKLIKRYNNLGNNIWNSSIYSMSPYDKKY